MTTIGLDLHKRESQLCIGFADGRIEQRRIATTRERFTEVLGRLERALAPARSRRSSRAGRASLELTVGERARARCSLWPQSRAEG